MANVPSPFVSPTFPVPASWKEHPLRDANRSTLQRLFANEVPALILRGFASPAECAALATASEEIGFRPYAHVQPVIDRIGVTVFEFDAGDRRSYFRAAEEATKLQRQIFDRSFDPLARLLQHVRGFAFDIDRAIDPVDGPYHAGLVRRINHGTLLHIDYAPFEHPEWSIAAVESQIAWNLYLETPSAGGATHVFERAVVPSDAEYKVEGTYGYRRKVVAGASRFTFKPSLGDVVLFNTRNFHEVEGGVGQRTMFTSAIGKLGDGSLVTWS